MGLVAVVLGGVVHGAPLILCSPFLWLKHPSWFLHAVKRHKATATWLPNFAFPLMGDRDDDAWVSADALATLRLVVNCSEPITPEAVDAFRSRMARFGLRDEAVSSSCAMAEMVFAVTQTLPRRTVAEERVDPVALAERKVASTSASGRRVIGSGPPAPGVRVRIVDDAGRPCPDGGVGEIRIKSPDQFDGYVGVGADVDAFDEDAWYRSGDYGYLRHGKLFVLGRIDDLIIRAG